jgi:hypothetical protein
MDGPVGATVGFTAAFCFIAIPFHLDILVRPVHLLGLSFCFWVWQWDVARAESGGTG